MGHPEAPSGPGSKIAIVRVMSDHRALVSAFGIDVTHPEGQRIDVGSGAFGEIAEFKQQRDLAGISIVELAIHFPLTIGAHFVAIWLHEKLSQHQWRGSINGKTVVNPDRAEIESAVEKSDDGK